MSSGVSFIFKTLIKIPCYIMVMYLVFNLFGFTLTYFKLLGFSYTIQQTAVENNYIPEQEKLTLTRYLNDISGTDVVEGARLVLDDPSQPSIPSATIKRQYGNEVVVGVEATYKFIWPLMPREQLNDEFDPTQENGGGFQGMSDTATFSGYADGGTLEARRAEKNNKAKSNIRIVYTVPGLKYYPDLGF